MGLQLNWLERYQEEAEALLRENAVRSLEFSGSTYQVEVYDSKKGISFWPFFQFDEEGQLRDAFCSCEKEEGCVHLAAALKKIYGKTSIPLHIRFAKSLWYHLCHLLAENLGYDSPILQDENQRFSASANERSFQIEAKTKKGAQKLSPFFQSKTKETPENSLKFSNLSQQEIARWKEGRANPHVRYVLSFWFDLAREWMLMQENQVPFSIKIEEDAEGWPTLFKIEWPDYKAKIEVKKEDLLSLIPSLESVPSPLKIVRQKTDQIESLTYDPVSSSFHITHKTIQSIAPVYRRSIGPWLYASQEGFYYVGDDTFLSRTIITQKEIPSFLDKYHELVAAHLKTTPFHTSPMPVLYRLYFDKQWNLHLYAYLFDDSDFTKPHAAFFKTWAYLPEKGFYPLLGALFDEANLVVHERDVPAFLLKYRIWLNSQKGFSIHLAGIEAYLDYTLDAKGTLIFSAIDPVTKKRIRAKDFGEWIYLEDQGFFSKNQSRVGFSVQPSLEIPADKVESFIQTHFDELQGIPHFFFPQNPILERGLHVQWHPPSSIRIKPIHTIKSDFLDAPLRFFGDIVYLTTKGFYLLPPEMRLPEAYRSPQIIEEESIADFYSRLDSLRMWVKKIDAALEPPRRMELMLHDLRRHAEGGLEASFSFQTEFSLIPLVDIWDALHKRQRFLFSSAGCFDLQQERFQWIYRLKRAKGENAVFLSTIDFLRLEAAEPLFLPPGKEPSDLLKELREFRIQEFPNPSLLKSELRLYQKTGLEWLWFLYRNGLSGLLCDEMGLGKTHQAMALIASILAVSGSSPKRFLVVCPTSVIYHWQDKLSLFLPHLSVRTFHGLKRTLHQLPEQSIVLTSYGILRMEKELFKSLHFEVAFFDEMQNAKNPRSRLHAALHEVKASMRIGLTGTPIENHLQELRALFELLLPGYLPAEKKFKELYIEPIQREDNPERKAHLQYLVRPFLLRRLKRDVLKELPEKTEEKSYCPLSEEQSILYQDLLNSRRAAIAATLRNPLEPVPYLHIFSVLTALKQICDHPALFHKKPEHYKQHESGKWDLFVELLQEARESGQKVVVFSQYLHMLDIFEHYFKENHIQYAQIRGDTQNRKAELERFRDDPQCEVFIGTLQAAGVGIDLTAASVVILYDRWWNAARENQAIDRVHRIGQTRGVQIFKLISMGTIEEKIDRIITQKHQLAEETLLSDDQSTLKILSRDELLDLLNISTQ